MGYISKAEEYSFRFDGLEDVSVTDLQKVADKFFSPDYNDGVYGKSIDDGVSILEFEFRPELKEIEVHYGEPGNVYNFATNLQKLVDLLSSVGITMTGFVIVSGEDWNDIWEAKVEDGTVSTRAATIMFC